MEQDKFGVKLKFPKRSCSMCNKYPCFDGIKKCKSDFAKYGCTYYREKHDNPREVSSE